MKPVKSSDSQVSDTERIVADFFFLITKIARKVDPIRFNQYVTSSQSDSDFGSVSSTPDRITWLGNEAVLNHLYQATVVREEIFSISNPITFKLHFTGEEIPAEKIVISPGKIGEALYLFNRCREREVHLLGRDAYLHRQMALHCTGERGPLKANSLRKMISRGCIRSGKRKNELDHIIEDLLWVRNAK